MGIAVLELYQDLNHKSIMTKQQLLLVFILFVCLIDISKARGIAGYLCNNNLGNIKERTFIMVKPDGVQRGLVGEIIKRFEQKGYRLVAMKMMHASEEHLKEHYAALSSENFFPGLIKYMNSGPVVPMVWEGLNVVKNARHMLGNYDPDVALPGTIRGDFSVQAYRNICHASDSKYSAKKKKRHFGSQMTSLSNGILSPRAGCVKHFLPLHHPLITIVYMFIPTFVA